MNSIRLLRARASVTQAELATAGGTSQPTIAAYESDRKSPSMATVRRLAAGVGLEAWTDYHPPMTREERRSLVLHQAIVDHLERDPDRIITLGRSNLRRMQRRARSQLLDEWDVLLDRPLSALLPVLTDPCPWARELRHVTPFAGVLSAGERTEVYAAFPWDERLVS